MTSTSESSPETGPVLAGRFVLGELIGEGGMGRVYAARDQVTGRPVAVKVLRETLASDERAVARFLRESTLLAGLRHPNVVAMEACGTMPDGTPFIVLERLAGESLGARLRRAGPLRLDEMVALAAHLGAALDAAHATGIIHRDVKPSNVFLTSQGTAKLLDFGVAKARGVVGATTSTGTTLGTVRYMAPEQLSAAPDLDARADVYALGLVLYEAFAGVDPFDGVPSDHLITAILVGNSRPLSQVRPDAPPRLGVVLARAMARVRTDRFQSAGELAEALAGVASGATFSGAVTPGLSETRSRLAALPDTMTTPAHAPRASSSTVRPVVRRPSRLPLLLAFILLIPLVLAATCGASVVGCQTGMTAFARGEVGPRLTRILASRPVPEHWRTEAATLGALDREGQTNWYALFTIDTRLDAAIADGDITDAELADVMLNVEDVLRHGGRYDFAHFWNYAGEDRPFVPMPD